METAAAPARMAAMTSALSRSRPPAMTGTCVRALISAMTRGMMPGRISTKSGFALLQLTGQAGQREGIQNECPLDGQQAAVARPADQGRAGGDDAVRVAQGVEGVHRDLPRRKAVHKVDVNHGQFSGIMYAVHQTVYGEQGARQQKNGAAGRSQRSSQGFVRFTAAITGSSSRVSARGCIG